LQNAKATNTFVEMNISPDQVQKLFPLAVNWVQSMERDVLERGIPLDAAQTQDARSAGVQNPEKVRILYASIPFPTDPTLRLAAMEFKLISPDTAGMTFGHGIVIGPEFRMDRELIVHELTHTGQYERLGGIAGFLQPYINECINPGYPDGPMEQEARQTAARIAGNRQ